MMRLLFGGKDPNGGTRLTLVEFDKGQARARFISAVTGTSAAPGTAVVSPDRKKIAFLIHEQLNVMELFVMDVSGVDPTAPVRIHEPLDVVLEGGVDTYPVFSADSTTLMFELEFEKMEGHYGFLTDVSGREPGATIPLDPNHDTFRGGSDIISADGHRIYGRGALAPGFIPGVFSLDVSSGVTPTPELIYEAEGQYYHTDKLCLSPDGTTVAFSQEVRSSTYHMYMADTSGEPPYAATRLHGDQLPAFVEEVRREAHGWT